MISPLQTNFEKEVGSDEDPFIMETILDWMPFARSLNRLRDSCVRNTHTRTHGDPG
jgi:hypothetical protein